MGAGTAVLKAGSEGLTPLRVVMLAGIVLVSVGFSAVVGFKLGQCIERRRRVGAPGKQQLRRASSQVERNPAERRQEVRSEPGEAIWISPYGECFHTARTCRGLRSARGVEVRRACRLCGG